MTDHQIQRILWSLQIREKSPLKIPGSDYTVKHPEMIVESRYRFVNYYGLNILKAAGRPVVEKDR